MTGFAATPLAMTGSYPNTRLRRTRASAWSRALHRENILTPADLIWPLFVTEGSGVEEPIATLPGVSRWSLDGIAARAKEAVGLGIPVIALFPNTPQDKRSDDGAEAHNPDNLMCRATNLLPFPALDGGRLLFVAIEGIRKKRIDPKIANTVNGIGFLILIGLMIVITIADVWKLF